MNRKLSTDSYKGVRDFYPKDFFARAHIFNTMRMVAERYGYVEYDASVLEPTELYTTKTSEEIINEQTYSFIDRGGRNVTLRPEMTPTVARMVAARRRDLAFPLRWFSIPNVFRYERPQHGRLREHWQLNVDLFGALGVEADIEVIMVAHELMHSFGARESDFVIRVNHRGLINTILSDELGIDGQTQHAVITLIDKKEKMEGAAFQTALAKLIPNSTDIILHFLETNDIDHALTDLAARTRDSKHVTELITILTTLKKRGVSNVTFDPSLVRGFDYYNGIVFEVYDTNKENKRSLFGGGRYDGLTELFDTEAIPAIGFGAGDVTILDFLTSRRLIPPYHPPTRIYLCTAGNEFRQHAAVLAYELRRQGVTVALDLSGKRVGDQVRIAGKHAIPLVVCIGEKEVHEHTYTVKELATSTQTTLTEAELVPFLLQYSPTD